MAMIRCADCGRQISDAAPACPNCGRPADAKRKGVLTRDEGLLLGQLAAHSGGSLLLFAFIIPCYFGSFTNWHLEVALIFGAAEILVFVLCVLAAIQQFDSRTLIVRLITAAVIGEAPSQLEIPTRGREIKVGGYLFATAFITAAAVTYVTAATGGLVLSPFSQFLLIAIVFGQITARHRSALRQTLLLGLVCFALLLIIDWRHWVSGPGKIQPWVYAAACVANLLFATALNRVMRRSRDREAGSASDAVPGDSPSKEQDQEPDQETNGDAPNGESE